MISSKFPKSFRAAGDLVVLGEFWKVLKKARKITTKFVKHHKVTSSPKTLRELAWNHLTVLWLNFERNRRLIRVLHGPSTNYNEGWNLAKTKVDSGILLKLFRATSHLMTLNRIYVFNESLVKKSYKRKKCLRFRSRRHGVRWEDYPSEMWPRRKK